MISLTEREQIVTWVDQARVDGARLGKACEVVQLAPRTLQRWRSNQQIISDGRLQRDFQPPNRLTDAEREKVLETANAREFAHLPPSQIVPILAERGEYIASESTFYRILREHKQLRHRLDAKPTAPRHKPKALTADAPNRIYSWDITYLPTAVKGMFYYLYLFMDVYSRKIVGWQVYDIESSEWAAEIVKDIALRENIDKDQVVLHSDNGGPMKGATLLATLHKLGIQTSFSRPSVSNDNPYSESLFRTLKYRSEYPSEPFADIASARHWVADFAQWYNHEHRHSSIGFVTPAQRHAGLDAAILSKRKAVYELAKAAKPERWSGNTRNWDPILSVSLNPNREPGCSKAQSRQAAA